MLKNMKIGKRLALSFLLMVLFMGVIIWVGISGMASIDQSLERIVKVNNARIDLVQDVKNNVDEEPPPATSRST